MVLLIAIFIPLLGYLMMVYFGDDIARMPRRYFYDEVVVHANGKQDTVWHKVKDMHFTNQLGQEVKLSDAAGKILVVDFFFTRCPVICPQLTRSMKKLQDAFVKNPDIVQFISISVDPVHDSVPNLRRFADRFGVNHDTWWFVTGPKEEVYDFAIKEMKANVADPGIDTAFIHTEDFFVLDRERIIRGWYNGLDQERQSQLAHDIATLNIEKQPGETSVTSTISKALPVVIIAIGAIILLYILMTKRKNKEDEQAS